MTRPVDESPEASEGCDVLLLAAFGPELAPLRPAFGSGDTLTGRVGPVRVAARACGVGLPAAAAHAALHIRDLRPKVVVSVGTCGAYELPDSCDRPLAIGDVVVCRHIRLVDPSALEGATEFPAPMGIAIAGSAALVDAFSAQGVRAADVATTLAITVNDVVAARIAAAVGAHVEHLEAYAVATACAALGVPFVAVLGVANFVGSQGRPQWRANHHFAADAAAKEVVHWLKGGGAGALNPRSRM